MPDCASRCAGVSSAYGPTFLKARMSSCDVVHNEPTALLNCHVTPMTPPHFSTTGYTLIIIAPDAGRELKMLALMPVFAL